MSSLHASPTDELQGSFTQLTPALQQGVIEAGYTTPTPVQEQAIPPILEGKDLIGTAQTGTGKTAAFVLPMLQRLEPETGKGSKPRALILAPTRELALQIGASIDTYGRHVPHRHTVIFGGVSQFHQEKALRKGVDLIVATPGRLLDLMNQGFIRLDGIEFFVLDEMDRMLDMGFLPDIKRILKTVPDHRQTLFFSATMSKRIEQIAANMVKNPVRVAIAPEQPAVERIRQEVLFVDPSDKLTVLIRLVEETPGKTIVFLQMKHAANKVVDRLQKAGIETAAIHGNKSQAARVRALDGFREGRYQVLVATDVAARGIDVDDISLVVNFDMPVEAETYVHRIGRTARAGAEGRAVSLCSPQDRAYLTAVEKLLGREVPVDLEHDHHSEEARTSTLKPRVAGQGRRGPNPKNRSRNKPSERRGRKSRRR
jgi:ATP-dependent RNA helicase RhlE